MKELQLFHGSNQIVKNPQILQTKYEKDFSSGFYCTNSFIQAKRWATRRNTYGIVNYYEYKEKSFLKILKFSEMTDDWLDFIANCRIGITHDYDIVEGPMADDTIWNFVNDFFANIITREQFWSLAKFKHPTHQICFHTERSLQCLEFLKGEKVND